MKLLVLLVVKAVLHCDHAGQDEEGAAGLLEVGETGYIAHHGVKRGVNVNAEDLFETSILIFFGLHIN